MKDLDLRCKVCNRYLNLKEVKTFIGKVRCPSSSCKELNNVQIVTTSSSESDIRYKFPDIIKEENTDE